MDGVWEECLPLIWQNSVTQIFYSLIGLFLDLVKLLDFYWNKEGLFRNMLPIWENIHKFCFKIYHFKIGVKTLVKISLNLEEKNY